MRMPFRWLRSSQPPLLGSESETPSETTDETGWQPPLCLVSSSISQQPSLINDDDDVQNNLLNSVHDEFQVDLQWSCTYDCSPLPLRRYDKQQDCISCRDSCLGKECSANEDKDGPSTNSFGTNYLIIDEEGKRCGFSSAFKEEFAKELDPFLTIASNCQGQVMYYTWTILNAVCWKYVESANEGKRLEVPDGMEGIWDDNMYTQFIKLVKADAGTGRKSNFALALESGNSPYQWMADVRNQIIAAAGVERPSMPTHSSRIVTAAGTPMKVALRNFLNREGFLSLQRSYFVHVMGKTHAEAKILLGMVSHSIPQMIAEAKILLGMVSHSIPQMIADAKLRSPGNQLFQRLNRDHAYDGPPTAQQLIPIIQLFATCGLQDADGADLMTDDEKNELIHLAMMHMSNECCFPCTNGTYDLIRYRAFLIQEIEEARTFCINSEKLKDPNLSDEEARAKTKIKSYSLLPLGKLGPQAVRVDAHTLYDVVKENLPDDFKNTYTATSVTLNDMLKLITRPMIYDGLVHTEKNSRFPHIGRSLTSNGVSVHVTMLTNEEVKKNKKKFDALEGGREKSKKKPHRETASKRKRTAEMYNSNASKHSKQKKRTTENKTTHRIDKDYGPLQQKMKNVIDSGEIYSMWGYDPGLVNVIAGTNLNVGPNICFSTEDDAAADSEPVKVIDLSDSYRASIDIFTRASLRHFNLETKYERDRKVDLQNTMDGNPEFKNAHDAVAQTTLKVASYTAMFNASVTRLRNFEPVHGYYCKLMFRRQKLGRTVRTKMIMRRKVEELIPNPTNTLVIVGDAGKGDMSHIRQGGSYQRHFMHALRHHVGISQCGISRVLLMDEWRTSKLSPNDFKPLSYLPGVMVNQKAVNDRLCADGNAKLIGQARKKAIQEIDKKEGLKWRLQKRPHGVYGILQNSASKFTCNRDIVGSTNQLQNALHVLRTGNVPVPFRRSTPKQEPEHKPGDYQLKWSDDNRHYWFMKSP